MECLLEGAEAAPVAEPGPVSTGQPFGNWPVLQLEFLKVGGSYFRVFVWRSYNFWFMSGAPDVWKLLLFIEIYPKEPGYPDGA